MVLQSSGHEQVVEHSLKILDEASVDGWRVPNKDIYPHQWLWDSCFHAIALTALGKQTEAVVEMENMFSVQSPEGFLPHMGYHSDPEASLDLWCQPGFSNITQPPMYGHALRVMKESLPSKSILHQRIDALIQKAELGLEWLLRHRRWFEPSSLAIICHPWETGCDDSLRWDGWMPEGVYDRPQWMKQKRRWAKSTLTYNDFAGPGAVSNPEFGVGDAGFNALLAFNARELSAVGGSDHLRLVSLEIAASLQKLFREETGTFNSLAILPDVDPYAQDNEGFFDGRRWWRTGKEVDWRADSVKLPTLDATLGGLVVKDSDMVSNILEGLVDPKRFGAQYGPRGAHASIPTYLPLVYWRGPAWPQLSYLCWVMASLHGNNEVASIIAEASQKAVLKNGFSEFWHPDTGEGGGPSPQTWATIVVAMRSQKSD